MRQFGMRIIWSWRQSRPCRLIRNVYLSLKEFQLRALPIIRLNRNNVLWPTYREGQTTIKHLIFLLSWNNLPSLWWSKAPYIILGSEHTSYLISLFCPWLSHVCGVLMLPYVNTFSYFSLINLSCIDLIIKSTERTLTRWGLQDISKISKREMYQRGNRCSAVDRRKELQSHATGARRTWGSLSQGLRCRK